MTLPELAGTGLMDPGWARALEPVGPDIAALGERLRGEVAAGRRYLPAGDRVLRAFQRPHAGASHRAVVRRRCARAPAAAEPVEHLPGARRRPRDPEGRARRPLGVER